MTQQAVSLLERHLSHFEKERDKINKEIDGLNYHLDGRKEQQILLDESVKDIKEALELLKK